MPRYTASTLEQAQAGGAIGWAIGQVDQLGRAAAAQEIRDAFPDMGNREINRLLNYAERATNVANEFELSTGKQHPRDRDIPVNPLLESGCEYEYYFEASWPTADEEKTGGFRVRICSPTSLTHTEAQNKALETLLDNITGNDTPGYNSGLEHEEDISWNLISIQRRG